MNVGWTVGLTDRQTAQVTTIPNDPNGQGVTNNNWTNDYLNLKEFFKLTWNSHHKVIRTHNCFTLHTPWSPLIQSIAGDLISKLPPWSTLTVMVVYSRWLDLHGKVTPQPAGDLHRNVTSYILDYFDEISMYIMILSRHVFFDLCLNERLSKQSWGWWFDTPSYSL